MKIHENRYIKSINKYRLSSVFSKIFISYICIIGMVVFSSIFTYYYMRNILIEKETETNKDYLNYLVRIVDGEFLHLQESMYGFLQRSQNITKIHNINNTYTQYDIVSELSQFKHNFESVDKCLLYSQELGFVLSDAGSFDKQFFDQMFVGKKRDGNKEITIQQAMEENPNLQFIPVIKKPFDSSFDEEDKNQQQVIMLTAGLNYSTNKDRLVFLLEEKSIRSILNNTNIVSYGSVYIVDDQLNILSSSKPEEVFESFDQELMDTIKKRQVSMDDLFYHDHFVVYQKSNYFDLYYITMIPKKTYLTI
ncbi:MAG: hypothetical protein GX238_11540 [Epulopiscium sp.]|nr:hypothetical protein [Candidatus Epulonipiscium sp.]